MKLLATLRRYWFLLAMITVLVWGSCWPQQWFPLTNCLPRDWIIGSVMLAMALSLGQASDQRAPSYLPPVVMAVVMQWCWIPGLAWIVSPWLVDELALGLAITAAVPCTLVSATVWTRLAGGNEVVSLLVTLVTNLSCFFVTPALLQLFVVGEPVALSFQRLAVRLLVLIVLPLGVAQGVLRSGRFGSGIRRRRSWLSVYAQLGLLSMVLTGAVRCGLELQQFYPSWGHSGLQLAVMCVLVVALHATAWGGGYWLAGRWGMAPPEQIAVAFAGSQKTLMVGMAVALPHGGLAILPLVAYHALQLVLDTVLADRLARRVDVLRIPGDELHQPEPLVTASHR